MANLRTTLLHSAAVPVHLTHGYRSPHAHLPDSSRVAGSWDAWRSGGRKPSRSIRHGYRLPSVRIV